MSAEFLNKYDTIIFDMDGVITSEQCYWTASALTVWEYLNWNRDKKIDTVLYEREAENIRKKVFCNDELITVLKGKGVNSNWDLAYVTVCMALICDVQDDFAPVLEYAKNLGENIIYEYDSLAKETSEKTGFDFNWAKRNALLWQTLQNIFQEWYLGEELFFKQYQAKPLHGSKRGLVFSEMPMFKPETVRELLGELSKSKRLCVATGRPYEEIYNPLKNWDCLKYFAKNGFITYDDVVNAEKEFNKTLSKPHPYVFLKALYGSDFGDEKLISGDYDKSKLSSALVVGDAGADILAALAMGADFCAVLTGVSGKQARGYFEETKADYILDSVIDLMKKGQ